MEKLIQVGHRFEPGKPACPVACKYCFITEHDLRREVWNANPIAGINKSSTFINVTPWIADDPVEQERFRSFPWEVLEGDFVGFTAITDPFWPILDYWREYWLEQVVPIAKLVTCVTKWPVKRAEMERLARIPNFLLVLGITGNEASEKVPMRKHLETFALAKELGVKALPISHPYIAGLSDLSFLPELKKLGYEHFDVKGLRYCDANMGRWMPDVSKAYYRGRENEEVLPEDGWREKVADAGLTLLSPRQWYLREAAGRGPNLDQETAERHVGRVLELANVVSSGSNAEVIEAAIRRRL